jgi:hypothetical protein
MHNLFVNGGFPPIAFNLMVIDLSLSLHPPGWKLVLCAAGEGDAKPACLFHDGVEVSCHAFGINFKMSLNSIGDAAQR